MLPYLARRLAQAIPVVIGLVTLVFLLIHLIPGDPVDLMLRDSTQLGDREHIRHMLGLDRSLLVQYFDYWSRIFHGDLGQSYIRLRPVKDLIWSRFPMTALLALSSLSLSCVLGIPAGIFAAQKLGGWRDRLSMTIALSLMSVPIFVVSPIAILIFAIRLRWFPVAGAGSVLHFVLPSLCLALSLSGLIFRMVRASMLDFLSEDFVRTARAKGLSENTILFKHVFRNALVPVLTIVSNILGSLMAGAVLTETIFDWPGLGRLFYAAFQSRDFPLIQGIVLWISVMYLLLNMFVDLVYSWIDPRIRFSGGRVG